MFYHNHNNHHQCRVESMISMRRASILVKLSLVLLVSRCLVVCVDEIKDQRGAVYPSTRQRNGRLLVGPRGEESLSSGDEPLAPVNRRTRELIVAQLRELCARHPAVCSSECASFELADDEELELVDNPTGIVCVQPQPEVTSSRRQHESLPRQQVPKSVVDELLLALSSLSGGNDKSNETMTTATTTTSTTSMSDEDLGYWTESGAASLSAQLEDLDGGGGDEAEEDENELRIKERLGRLFEQSQRVANLKLPARVQRQQQFVASAARNNNNNPANTYRVSYEQAKRFIQTQERQRHHHFRPPAATAAAAAALMMPVRLSDSLWPATKTKSTTTTTATTLPTSTISRPPPPDRQQDNVELLVASGRRSMRLHRSDGGTTSTVNQLPKRTSSASPSVEEMKVISTTTSGHKLNLQDSSTTAATTTTTATTTTSADALQCNKRQFTYKATKSDGAGNSCSGLVTASICYGGCDTGEIADWLFPYKKSIHKVCRHGGRVRRHVTLNDCTSQLDSINENLRTYYYVDARDCVCKKCTSVDTTCLGSMTQPQLQTLGETVAAMTSRGNDAISGGGDD